MTFIIAIFVAVLLPVAAVSTIRSSSMNTGKTALCAWIFLLMLSAISSANAAEVVQRFTHDQWDVTVYDNHDTIVLGNGILVAYDKDGVHTVAFQVEGQDTLTIESHEYGQYQIKQYNANPYGDGLLAVEGDYASLAFMRISFNEAILVNGKYFDTSTYMDAISLVRSF